jgi:hypothetical protein
MPRIVLLAMSLLMACIPTPTSSAATNLATSFVAPLTLYASWDDDINPTQTYKVVIRDIPARKSYNVYGINAKEFLLDAAMQAQMFEKDGGVLVVSASKPYAIQIMGETDKKVTSKGVGYMRDMVGPPRGPVLCDATDETSVNQFYSYGVPPYGCQNKQVSGKVRLYWWDPVDSGYYNGSPVTILGYVFQWSLDSTFTSNVVEETCMDANPDTTIEGGAVCTFNWFIAQIPSSGTLSGGEYFIRVAAVVTLGVGPFTEAVSVQIEPGPSDTICPAGQYEDADACIDCPAWTNSTIGASDIADCKCLKGYTAESDGVVCTVCAAHFWKDVVGSSPCYACPLGLESPEGSQDVLNCKCPAEHSGNPQ